MMKTREKATQMHKKVSQDAIEALKMDEGYDPVAIKRKNDVWTGGHGHTKNVKKNQKFSRAESEALLKEDLSYFERVVNEIVTVELNQNQFDALVLLMFNVGESAIKKSKLLKKLNAGDYLGAATEFCDFVHLKGEILIGLVRRRGRDCVRFMTPHQ